VIGKAWSCFPRLLQQNEVALKLRDNSSNPWVALATAEHPLGTKERFRADNASLEATLLAGLASNGAGVHK
jgi:hypothetical protein